MITRRLLLVALVLVTWAVGSANAAGVYCARGGGNWAVLGLVQFYGGCPVFEPGQAAQPCGAYARYFETGNNSAVLANYAALGYQYLAFTSESGTLAPLGGSCADYFAATYGSTGNQFSHVIMTHGDYEFLRGKIINVDALVAQLTTISGQVGEGGNLLAMGIAIGGLLVGMVLGWWTVGRSGGRSS